MVDRSKPAHKPPVKRETWNVTAAAQLAQPVLKRVFEVWDELRGTRHYPSHLAQSDLPDALRPFTFIATYTGNDFWYRFVGSDVTQHNGYAAVGGRLSDYPLDNVELLADEFHKVLRHQWPRYSAGWFLPGDENFARIERVLMPFSSNVSRPDGLLGAVYFHTAAHGAASRVKNVCGQSRL